MEFVGRTVRKEFNDCGVFLGTVKSYDSATGLFKIWYEDRDYEELELSEINTLLGGNGDLGDQSGAAEPGKKPSRVGRRPKKRQRLAIEGNSGNVSGNIIGGRFLNRSWEEIEMKHGAGLGVFGKTLENECEAGENCTENVLVNGNLDRNEEDLNHGLNLNDELIIIDGVDLNQGFNLNDELNLIDGVFSSVKDNLKRKRSIDLNMVANDDESWNLRQDDAGGLGVDTQKRGLCFDLNLGLDDEAKNLDAEYDGQFKENVCSRIAEDVLRLSADGALKKVHIGIVEGTSVNGFTGSTEIVSDAIQKEDRVILESSNQEFGVFDAKFVNDGNASDALFNVMFNAGTPGVNGSEGNLGSTHRGRNSRKRRKLSEAVNPTTETVLRRSARTGRATFAVQNHVSSKLETNADDLSSSPAVSAVSEEKLTVSGHDESEERSILPLKLQLPPSSGNLNIDGIPILDIFSVYSFLRSFSYLLFLSPFELEDFVAALKCEAPNQLFDSIHVSLLQTLRKHLEFLSNEGSQSASNCLRSLNWDLLDLITWPVFMVGYLLIHGAELEPGYLSQLKLFESEYYKQLASTKIEILRCLCDDVIEVEAIRSELSRRTLGTDPNMDFDWNYKSESSKRRKDVINISCGSCLMEEVTDETADWNSDECCLCKMDGNLICCDGCPAAFHLRCVGVANNLLPEGDWYCPECVINKDKPWMKVGKPIRGAELLGIDPYGLQYYCSSGYLLVCDSCNTESSFSYYHRNDLTVVIEVLKSSGVLYSSILSAINKHWGVNVKIDVMKSELEGQMTITPLLLPAPSETGPKCQTGNEGKPEERSLISTYSDNLGCEVSEVINTVSVTMNNCVKMENLLASSEGSAETSHATTDVDFSKSAGISCNFEIPGKLLSLEDCSRKSLNLKGEQRKLVLPAPDCMSSPMSTIGSMSEGQCGTTYMNYYSLARTASSVAEELARRSSDKMSEASTVSAEEVISMQLKVTSKKSPAFCWPNIESLFDDARKEKCGWCFYCKFPEDDRDCFFTMNYTGPNLRSYTSDVLALCSRKNRTSYLTDIICQLLCIEDHLHGFLSGPWLNPHYRTIWRRSLLRGADISSVKHLLLKLEANLHRLALSVEWLKYVDSVSTMGSASHVMTSSSRVSSKHGIGKRRNKCSDVGPNPSSNAATGLGLYWWRGGRLSRWLFNWKVLPQSLASKAARQAGCKKIPGILYPDSSEFAKRSNYVAWRASVETSKSVVQLALQVRELNANIRWDDIGNTVSFFKMDKESRKSIRSFKKVIIRRKCTEGTVVKYLLDFGKRRFIPDIVVRHGFKLEESSSGRKKYWLEECYVPLHILKAFEEKRIARKSNKMSSGKLHDSGRASKKPSKKIGFSYLFSRAERSDYYQCGHCNKDVLIREAVSCQYCQGFFHKRHVRKSAGAITEKCTYTCYKCQDGLSMKVDKRKLQSQTGKKGTKILRSMRSSTCKKFDKGQQPPEFHNNKKGTGVVPLRRSPRKLKCVTLQSKRIGGRHKGERNKSRKGITKKPTIVSWQKKRTLVYHTYWLNGLLLSRKPGDARVSHFRNKKLLVSSEQLTTALDKPKCALCCESEFSSSSDYVCCEVCGDWFHGYAFGLCAQNISKLIGFKCHKCLCRASPVCPHLHAIRCHATLLSGSKNDPELECAAEVSNGVSLENDTCVKQKSHFAEKSKAMLSNESCNREQQSGIASGSNQTLQLDEESVHLAHWLGAESRGN